MRVYMATYQSVSILHGGPNTQIRSTAEHLRALGIEIRFFDPWTRFVPEQGDLVHLFGANIGTYHLARELKTLGVPLVVSPITYSRHGSAFVRRALATARVVQRLGPGLWSDYGLCADICGWAAKVVPNTQAEARLVIDGLGVQREKVTVVPNGVDPKFASGDPELFVRKYGLRGYILNVGHVGHVRKNVLHLIRALAGIDHPAVIVGRFIRSPYGDQCRREAERYKHILLIDGFEYGSEMLASAYAACDTFVLPSQFETPGIAALEAGLAGAKIVITPHGGTREYFGEFAEYVDPDSVDSIREGITHALGKPSDGRLRERIRRNYLWETVAVKTRDVYGMVMGDAGISRRQVRNSS